MGNSTADKLFQYRFVQQFAALFYKNGEASSTSLLCDGAADVLGGLGDSYEHIPEVVFQQSRVSIVQQLVVRGGESQRVNGCAPRVVHKVSWLAGRRQGATALCPGSFGLPVSSTLPHSQLSMQMSYSSCPFRYGWPGQAGVQA